MTDQNPQIQQHMSKITESLNKENRMLQLKLEEMEKERKAIEEERKRVEEEKARMENDLKSYEQRFQEANLHIEKMKREKRAEFEHVLQNDINPYLEKLAESNKENPKLLQSINHFKGEIQNDLQTGDFLKDEKENNFLLVHAMASAGQVTSSKLDEIFQARKDWEAKMEQLRQEKEAKEKEWTTANEEKEKMIEQLKKELETVKTNIKNVDGHFSAEAKDQVMEDAQVQQPSLEQHQPQMITATASRTPTRGYSSLYAIKPVTNWYSNLGNAEANMLHLKETPY